jgi:lipopolysaccharide export system permease protein
MLKLLDRYIARQFLVTLLFASLSFVALFILISMVENLGKFIDKMPAITDIVLYYLTILPETILITMPISVLLASLFVTGKMAMLSELPALKSAGVSMDQLLKPFALVSLVITALNIVNSCWIVPSTYAKKNAFEAMYLNKSFSKSSGRNNLHIRESSNRILSIAALNSDGTQGSLVSLEEFRGAHLKSRIDADSIRFDQSADRWIFHNPRTRSFSKAGEQFTFNPKPELVKLSFRPEALNTINAEPDEMNLVQHYRFIQQQKKAGFSELDRTSVKFHSKIALPFASLIIILIGVPLSTKKKRSGLALEAGISLFIGFLYLGMQKTLSTIGYRGIIDPMLAAWLPNLIFLAVGSAIYRSANK